VTPELKAVIDAANALSDKVNNVVHPGIVREVVADYREALRRYMDTLDREEKTS
jgi:hypothetical protein